MKGGNLKGSIRNNEAVDVAQERSGDIRAKMKDPLGERVGRDASFGILSEF